MRGTVTGRTTDHWRVLLVGAGTWVSKTQSALTTDDDRIECTVAETLEDAIDELTATAPPFHAVIVTETLWDDDGLAALDRLDTVAPTVPVIAHPEQGSERLAGEAIGWGVADYVPTSSRDELRERVQRVIEDSVSSHRLRTLAERFETVFDDPDRCAVVLDLTGRVRTANGATWELFDAPPDELLDTRFVDPPWCTESVRDSVERAIQGATEGDTTRLDLDGLFPTASVAIEEITIRPVRSGSGAVTELLVLADDETRRRRVETMLRRSERLHRITLNNMTDTVLVTDDDGEFVYVCPNVHFIFGYTVEEVQELGTIEALLDDGLFDPEELAAEGVLTNIECTTTDKSGTERTLLVNVKEVSIQGGTRLYSCRDVTTRKERERALTTLHGTARKLLYAETEREIARTVVRDATETLGADGAALYRFDGDDAVLRPIAVTEYFETIHGPLPELAPDVNSIVGQVFVEGEPATFADVHDTDRLTNPATSVRGATYVPIGEHGVLLVGSETRDAFDLIATEVADLVAATAEAAFDRVDRMAALRHRDRELRRRNERLGKINRINDLIREIDRSIVSAESREEIEHAVCEKLTLAGRFGFAWIVSDETAVNARATGGQGRDYLDAIRTNFDDGAEPAAAAARLGDVVVVENVAENVQDEPWRMEALTRGFQAAIAVPLAYEGITYGTLAVYATDPGAFDEVTRDVLVELGETVASAIGSLTRKDAILERSWTELEYETADPACLPYAIARRAECRITLEGGIQRVEDGVLAFVRVEGSPADQLAAEVREFAAVEEATAVDVTADGGTIRLRLSNPFIATTLAEHGIVLRHLTADPESAHIVVDVPGSVGTRTADEVIGTVYNQRTLLAQRERDRQLGAEQFRSAVLDSFTDRQLEVARTAYHRGYYSAPRTSTGEEVAESLDVTPATFYQANKRIQAKLFTQLFDDH